MNEWISLLRALCDASVRFLVVGGFATIAHGYVRATDDLDIWVDATRANIEKLGAVLDALGVDQAADTLELLDPYSFIRVGSPMGRRLDLMSHAEGLLFGRAWHNRHEIDLEGIIVPVVGLDDLLTTKKLVGRHKDLADVESLQSLHHLDSDNE